MTKNLSRVTRIIFDDSMSVLSLNETPTRFRISVTPVSSDIEILPTQENTNQFSRDVAIDSEVANVVGQQQGDFEMHLSKLESDIFDAVFLVDICSAETGRLVASTCFSGVDLGERETKATENIIEALCARDNFSSLQGLGEVLQELDNNPYILRTSLEAREKFFREALEDVIVGNDPFYKLLAVKLGAIIAENSFEAFLCKDLHAKGFSLKVNPIDKPGSPKKSLTAGFMPSRKEFN